MALILLLYLPPLGGGRGGMPPWGGHGGDNGWAGSVGRAWDVRGVALRTLRDGGSGEDGQAAARHERGRTGRKPLEPPQGVRGAARGMRVGCAWDGHSAFFHPPSGGAGRGDNVLGKWML